MLYNLTMPNYYFNSVYYQIDFEYFSFIVFWKIRYEALPFRLYFSLVRIMGGGKKLFMVWMWGKIQQA